MSEKMRVVSVSSQRSMQRVCDLVTVALLEITPAPTREQHLAACNAALRHADQEGIVLTKQVTV